MTHRVYVALVIAISASIAHGGPSAKITAKAAESDEHEAVRARGAFFSKIAVDRDYGGEWVIARTPKSTAFLDIVDWRHPRSRAASKEARPAIHILVVPNRRREHIAEELGGRIRREDLRVALEVFGDAHRLARRLGIRSPTIYANSESKVDVGYFHVHIVGELPARTKLPRVQK